MSFGCRHDCDACASSYGDVGGVVGRMLFFLLPRFSNFRASPIL